MKPEKGFSAILESKIRNNKVFEQNHKTILQTNTLKSNFL